ncbi:carbohydrate ABC transporter permease [Porcincola intestinalis]|jgi:multiple sugar transport system permease protein|uniref:Carbohydrate ABC transporter permease n=1 Tax=Porcincola intestinalis TaxID=2606632 RepID=A0A6L5X2Z6_9FIRM|nr:carbohydrate ABC transporter permease [Porcincola intestinalis]MSS13753.1 carbohydrate ABC transporter permease [Porcincola intestinalis]HAE16616.1 carbohydrate ABC transporter permease [Erysipelotrichaceae bacterium]HCG58903.1 carbohydrate ABC transporter permease [Lachnospiraceae bacterium]
MGEEKKITGRKNVILCIVSVLVLCFLLFPLFWTLNTSLKTEQEIFQNPPTFYPHVLNTQSYAAQVETGDFNMFRSFANSFLISLSSMLIAVVLAVPASYAIAKYRFKGRKVMLLFFLVTQMLPVSVLLTPMFIMFKGMHVYNTWWSAILADTTIGIPFSILILKNYFASIPKELEEAAYIDGCTRFGAFMRILVPVAKPGIIVCAVFSFLYAWGDLAYGMTFILDQQKRPITAGIFNFMGQYGTKWSYLSAFAIVTIIPVAVIFIFMQKYIIAGMTNGAVKG